MKQCKSCGIIFGKSLEVKNRYSKYCRICYKHMQSDKFKFWYDTKGKKPSIVHTKTCNICNKEFTTVWSKQLSCSDKCRLKYRNIKRKVNRMNNG